MGIDARTFSQMSRFSLDTIYEELKSAPEELESYVGQPLEILSANESEVVYVAPNGYLIAEYTIDDDSISFDNMRMVEDIAEESVEKSTIKEFVQAIINEDSFRADQLWEDIEDSLVPSIVASTRIKSRVEPLRHKIQERLESVSDAVLENLSNNPYLLRENYRSLDRLESVREEVLEAADLSICGVDINEQAFQSGMTGWTTRGTGKLRRHRVDRKKSRKAKVDAKKHRGSLLKNLKKAKISLKSIAKKPSFRKRVSKVRRLNASVEPQECADVVMEICENQTSPSFAYATISDMREIITQALKYEGIKALSEKDENFVQDLAENIVLCAREIRPVAKRHIVDAASLIMQPYEDLDTDDVDEAVEIIANRLYEAIADEDERNGRIAQKALGLIEGLIDEVTDEIDESDRSEEAKSVRTTLENLKEFRTTLNGYVERPETTSIPHVYSMIESIDTAFAPSVIEEDFEDDAEDMNEDGDLDGANEDFDFDVPGSLYGEDDEIEESKKSKKEDDEDDSDDDDEDDEIEESKKSKKDEGEEDDEEDSFEEGKAKLPDWLKSMIAKKKGKKSDEEKVDEACKSKGKSKKSDDDEVDSEEEMDEACKGKGKKKKDEEDMEASPEEGMDESKKSKASDDDGVDDDPEPPKKSKKKKSDDESEDGDEDEDIPEEEDGMEENVTFVSEYTIDDEGIAIPEGTEGVLSSDGSIRVDEGDQTLTLVNVPEEYYEIQDPLA